MYSEYLISKESVMAISKKYGGSLKTDAKIDAAVNLGLGKNVYMKIAYLWNAILAGNPFSNGNKRTALMVALTLLENFDLNERKKEKMALEIKRVAKEKITDIKRIEKLVRYAASGN